MTLDTVILLTPASAAISFMLTTCFLLPALSFNLIIIKMMPFVKVYMNTIEGERMTVSTHTR